MDGYGYLYLNQNYQGTIKRIDFYGNVSASATHMPLNCMMCPMLAEPHNRWTPWKWYLRIHLCRGHRQRRHLL